MQQHFASSETVTLAMPPPAPRQETTASASPLPLAPTVGERRRMQARIKKLRHHSLLTPSALAQMGQADLPTETLHALLTLLEGPFEERWEERTAAAWALGLARLSPRQQQTVSHTLCRVLRRKQIGEGVRPNWWLNPLLIGSVLAFVLLYLSVLFRPEQARWVGNCLSLMSVLFFAARMLHNSIQTSAFDLDSRLRTTTATALGRIAHVNSVATLARAALDSNASVRNAAEPALCVCLSQLREEHSGQMQADVVPNLCRLLEKAREQLSHDVPRAESLALCVLAALEKIGDGRATPAVRNLINTGWTSPVNRAAKELMPLLLARQKQEKDQRILLRATVMPIEASHTLLRPMGINSDDDSPHTLLRPLQKS